MATTMPDPEAAEAPTADAALEVRASKPTDDRTQDAYALEHPRATFFHRPGWRRVIERVHGHVGCDLLAWRGDRLVGLLPLMECRTLRGQLNLISMPYAVYGGPIGDDAEVERALVEAAVKRAERAGMGHLELRYLDDPGNDMVKNELYWTFFRELPDEPEGVLKSMPKKARAEARKARDKHQLEMTEGEWYLDDLYRMFLENKHALGSPGLPQKHFRGIRDEFGDKVSVHLVRQGRMPLAAVMSFAFRDTLIAYYAGTQTGADRAYSASNFMYMALQEWAVERGFRVFDFCRSRADSGAFQFKKHQGFEPRPLNYRYHLVRSAGIPDFTPSNPKTRLVRTAWTHLPTWAVRMLSDRLARFLP